MALLRLPLGLVADLVHPYLFRCACRQYLRLPRRGHLPPPRPRGPQPHQRHTRLLRGRLLHLPLLCVLCVSPIRKGSEAI